MEAETYDSLNGYVKTPGDYLRALVRHKLAFVTIVAVVAALAVAAALMIPPSYRSVATILIEEPEVPRELVESTVTSYADQRIQMIKYRIMTRDNLKQIMDRFGLYLGLRQNTPLSEIYTRFRDDIKVETIEARVLNPQNGRAMRATIAFKLGYRSPVARQAQQVTNELVTLFLAENTKTRQVQAAATRQFLTQEADQLAGRISEIEAKLALFKRQNASRLPDRLNVNLEILDLSERRLDHVNRRVRSLAEQRDFLQSEIARMPARFEVAVGNAAATPQQRADEFRDQIANLRRTLGPKHPDLISAQAGLEALEAALDGGGSRTASAAAAINGTPNASVRSGRGAYASPSPETRTTLNPAYMQVRSQLNAVKVELAELREERTMLSDRIKTYKTRVRQTPAIESEYAALVREYETSKLYYRTTRDKQRAAELAESLETERKSERFILVEPPQLPNKPEGLAKWMIAGIGLAIAFVVASALIFLFDMFDNRIHGSRQLAAVTGEDPILVVPRVSTPAERRWAALRGLLTFVGTGVVVAAGFAAVHYFVVPLDSLWYRQVLPGFERVIQMLN